MHPDGHSHSWLLRALRYAWASPTTALGVLIALLAVLTGGRWHVRDGAIEASGGVLRRLLRSAIPLEGGARALTLGHVVLARTDPDLDATRAHERVHVRQSERWGPLFIPAYLSSSAWAAIRGRDAYRDNPFEREAYERCATGGSLAGRSNAGARHRGTGARLAPLAPYARALLDFHAGVQTATLTLRSSLGELDELPAALFFRRPADFFPFETYALELCRGRTLDAGAGTGIHSLELQARGMEVTALELLPELIEIQRGRGVRRWICADLKTWAGERYDTVLMLMNGIGPVGTLTGLDAFLVHAHRLVAPGGQVLVDSGEAIRCGKVDPRDAARWPPTDSGYPGEAWIELEYAGQWGAPFRELYVDMHTLAAHAERSSWNCDVVFEAEAGGYLARLTVADHPRSADGQALRGDVGPRA